ncbi:MAG: nitroreductase family protein [Chloroflexota bacterium]|nr:nitroreductase family protein [Chloroflexota bacterium]
MEVYEAIRTRRTVRQYKPDPVAESVIMKILRAGRWSPSSSNSQPWHFVVVTDPDTIARLAEVATQGPFIADAPLVIAIVMVPDAPRPQLDAGRALQQMELVAWEEGLGTCFVGVRIEEQQVGVKEILGIPEDHHLITLMPYGYRTGLPSGRASVPRKPMSEIAHRNRFGTPYEAA